MERNPRFDVLLFDLGGVLMDFAGFDELGPLIPGAPDRTEIRDRWIRSDSVQRFERGEITPDRFAACVIEEFEIDLPPRDFLTKFVEWAREPSPAAIALLESLKHNFRIAALSNANELHTPLHRQRFAHVVDTFYFSDEIGVVKPEHAIYKHVVDNLGVSPSRIAFFDDTPVNVDAARKAGIVACRVDGFSELEARLHLLGVFGGSIGTMT